MNFFLKGLSPIYYGATRLRNSLYDKKLLEQVQVDTPVLCIGNISFGGSGKTPFTRWLCLQEFAYSKKIAIVSRAYSASYKGDLQKLGPEEWTRPEVYGDEACMLAGSLDHIDVYVTNNKSAAVKSLTENKNYDLILVDDGFQHRKLVRNLDFVLLDTSVGISAYQRFPKGELREDLAGLDRADVLIFSKAKADNPELIEQLSEYSSVKPNLVMGYELGAPCRITPKSAVEFLEKSKLDYLLVTAVGNPGQVRESFEEEFGPAKDELLFKDHHQFNDFDLLRIEDKLKNSGAKYVLCTEKDYFKLRNKMKNSSSLYYVPQDYKLLKGKEELDEVFRALFSKDS